MYIVRLEGLLPKLMSNDRSAFVKGRRITENFFTCTKIIVDIKKRSKTANVVFKLDMEKAYDRVD